MSAQIPVAIVLGVGLALSGAAVFADGETTFTIPSHSGPLTAKEVAKIATGVRAKIAQPFADANGALDTPKGTRARFESDYWGRTFVIVELVRHERGKPTPAIISIPFTQDEGNKNLVAGPLSEARTGSNGHTIVKRDYGQGWSTTVVKRPRMRGGESSIMYGAGKRAQVYNNGVSRPMKGRKQF